MTINTLNTTPSKIHSYQTPFSVVALNARAIHAISFKHSHHESHPAVANQALKTPPKIQVFSYS